MLTRIIGVSVLCLGVFSGVTVWMAAPQQNPDTIFHVNVNMVQLDVAVTDKKGNYITGLNPWDFEIYEDGISQKMATFGEENEVPRSLADYPRQNSALGEAPPTKTGRQAREGAVQSIMRKESPDRIASLVAGASVFILFDTSNYVQGVCIRPGCYSRIRPVARPSVPGGLLFLQPQLLPHLYAHA